MLVERIYEAKQKKIKQWPVNSNRASEMGHPCLRYLVLLRTRWEEKSLHDARLQMVFDLGNSIERLVEQDLKEAGFSVVEQHRPFEWKKYQITGSIDFKLIIDNEVYPCEVKSAAPHAFESVNSVSDMLKHKWAYMRKYPAQLCLYLLMDNKERGLFLFKNKSSGEIKEIWLDLDMDFAETLVRKAETINSHVIAGSLPDPIAYDENICDDCGFAHICLPERIGKEVQIIDDQALSDLLDQRARLMPSAKEFDEVDEEIKAMISGKDKLLVGDWYITGKWQERTNYDLPAEVKAQYKLTNKYWKATIVNAKKGE